LHLASKTRKGIKESRHPSSFRNTPYIYLSVSSISIFVISAGCFGLLFRAFAVKIIKAKKHISFVSYLTSFMGKNAKIKM